MKTRRLILLTVALLVPALPATGADWQKMDIRFTETSEPWKVAGQKVTARVAPDPAGAYLSVTDPVRGYGQGDCPQRIPVEGLMEIRATAVLRCAEVVDGKAVVDLLIYDSEDKRLEGRVVIGETTSAEWTEATQTFTVPPGAAYLTMRFCPAWPLPGKETAHGTAHLRSVIFERVTPPKPPRSYMSDIRNRVLDDLGDYVPPPWTPIEAEGDTIRCWGREHSWDKGVFPSRIKSQDVELLAGPIVMRWQGETSGDIVAEAWTTDKAQRSQVIRSAKLSGGGSGKAAVTAEYDGALRIDLDMDFSANPIRRLDLIVPLRKEVAEFMHYDHGIGAWMRPFPWSGAVAEKGPTFRSKFLPFLWLGNDDVGLCLFTESDEHWLLDDPETAVEVVEKGDRVELILHLVDTENASAARRSYTFGLEATPCRPLPADFRQMHVFHYAGYYDLWKDRKQESLLKKIDLAELRQAGVGYVGLHAWWADRVCGFRPAMEDDFRAFMRKANELGIRVQTYLAFMMASKITVREIEGATSWVKIPSYYGWKGGNADCYQSLNTCPQSDYAGVLVRGALDMVERYGISGVYWDNHPAMCQNGAHGCGYDAVVGGKTLRRPTCAMWSARRLIKEVYERLKRRDPNAFVTVHLSWFPHPYLMFADTLLTGEGFALVKNNYLADGKTIDVVPLSAFRAELMGSKFGLKTCFCLYNTPSFLPASLAAGECFIHDIDIRKFDSLGWIGPVWKAFDEFGTSRARFVGYWRLEGKAFPAGMIKTSAYVRDREALLVIANLTRRPGETTIDLSQVIPGGGNFVARDVLKGMECAVEGGRVRVPLETDAYALVRISAR